LIAATAGKLKITVHANASLFKANEIKRAVQGGQAQIGEVLLVNFENENPSLRRRRYSLLSH
jgi:TRAP-type C4-dicarboxylate transport system substrate-binding protein